jgi:hypothetical protein
MVEVQCPAETFATPNRSACDRIAPPSIDQLIPEPLVIALQMIVRSVLVHCLPQVPFANGITCAKHSDLIEPTNRSAYAFRFGLRAGNRIGSVPLDRTICRNAPVNSGSRSWIR